MEERPESRRGKGVVLAGWALVVAGVIGVIGGVVPFSLNAFRILGGEKTWSSSSLAGHGVEALGLSVEWAMLSSAIGAYLGALLLASGRAWLKGLDAARLLTWIYVAGGVTVNATDLAIFLFHAETWTESPWPFPWRWGSCFWSTGRAPKAREGGGRRGKGACRRS